MLFIGSLSLLLVACQTGPKVETEVYERDDGVIVVESVKLEATVTAIDAQKRQLTLKPKYGDAKVFKADKDDVNFGQIQVGDVVHAVVVEEFAVTIIKGGAPESVGEAAAVAVAGEGEKPGVVMAATTEVTGTIVAIDAHEHTVSLEFLDGKTRTVKVGKHRDLSELKLGDSVRIQLTEALAISVEKKPKT